MIYHPHGILPEELMDFPRDRLVFSESEYAKLFLGSLVGDFSFLLNHMSKNTCAIVGSSLEDEDLRNVLIQSAQSNPGNPHYYVQFLGPHDSISPGEAKAIRRANFHVYNLITLFLTEHGIAALADLLYGGFIEDCEFADRLVESGGSATYHFYLTGALGVGKSTTTTQLRNLTVLDEWAEPRLSLLAKPWDALTRKEEEKVNNWIVNQFRIKNDRLRHEKFSIALVDRPPMDPLAFTTPAKRPAKAKVLLDTISAGGKWKIADGIVIVLTGDPKELAARVLATGRDGYTAKKLAKMEKDLRSVYNGDGVTVVETRGKSVADVTRRVSEIIHFDDYKPFTFARRLKAFESSPKKTKAGHK